MMKRTPNNQTSLHINKSKTPMPPQYNGELPHSSATPILVEPSGWGCRPVRHTTDAVTTHAVVRTITSKASRRIMSVMITEDPASRQVRGVCKYSAVAGVFGYLKTAAIYEVRYNTVVNVEANKAIELCLHQPHIQYRCNYLDTQLLIASGHFDGSNSGCSEGDTGNALCYAAEDKTSAEHIECFNEPNELLELACKSTDEIIEHLIDEVDVDILCDRMRAIFDSND